jgi:PmbA protein
MMLENLVNHGLQYADDVEVYYARNMIFSVNGEKNNLKAESVIDQGIGVRVQIDGKIGFAFSTDLSDESVVQRAVSIARCKKELVNLEFPCKEIPEVKGLYSAETAAVSLEECAEYLNEVCSVDDRKINKMEASLEIRKMERAIANSAGLEVCEPGTFVDLSLIVQGCSVVSEDVCHRSFNTLNCDPLIGDLMERAKESPQGSINQVIDTIILSPEAGALLFTMLLCPAFCADNVLQKQSFLRNYEGKMVASEELSMRDDATLQGGVVSRSFDAEGSPSTRVPLIENGRLSGFLHNARTAVLTGEESTGNAFRDYRNEPIVFPSNVILDHEYSMPIEHLIEETHHGVMARGIVGAYSSDYITGDFSVTLDECYLIENGNVKRVHNVSVGGNAYTILKSIDYISTEKRQCGHFLLPALKISGLKIIP